MKNMFKKLLIHSSILLACSPSFAEREDGLMPLNCDDNQFYLYSTNRISNIPTRQLWVSDYDADNTNFTQVGTNSETYPNGAWLRSGGLNTLDNLIYGFAYRLGGENITILYVTDQSGQLKRLDPPDDREAFINKYVLGGDFDNYGNLYAVNAEPSSNPQLYIVSGFNGMDTSGIVVEEIPIELPNNTLQLFIEDFTYHKGKLWGLNNTGVTEKKGVHQLVSIQVVTEDGGKKGVLKLHGKPQALQTTTRSGNFLFKFLLPEKIGEGDILYSFDRHKDVYSVDIGVSDTENSITFLENISAPQYPPGIHDTLGLCRLTYVPGATTLLDSFESTPASN